MKIKTFYILLMLCVGGQLFAQQKMSAAEAETFRNAVNAAAKTTRTLQTDFTQLKHMDFLAKDIESSGKMFFKAGQLKWQYVKPYQYSIIFKKDKILINDAGKKSNIDNNKMFDKLSRLIMGSVSGNMFDEKEFTISYLKDKTQNLTVLIPKDASLRKYIGKMELYFDKTSNTVTEVRMIEPSGDYTKIIFKNKALNSSIDDSVFNQ